MTLLVRDSAGALRDVGDVLVRDADGVLKAVDEGWVLTPTGLKQFLSSFSVSVDSAGAASSVNSAGTATVTTRAVTAVVEGAIGTPTFLWTQPGGDAGWTIVSPTLASTRFATDVGPGEDTTATFKCTVGDSAGHSADSEEISATATNRYGPRV